MSNDEFSKLHDDLPAIDSKIIQDPSPNTLDEIQVWANEAKDSGKFNKIKWGVINRVFAAANPQKYSTILKYESVVELINKLNELYHGLPYLFLLG